MSGGQNDARSVGKALHDLFRELFALHAALSKVMDGVHEAAGLSTPQLKIAGLLNEPATVPDMAARLGVSRQAVQTICNGLLDLGLLEFKRNPRHRRSRLAALTGAGRAAYQEARRREEETIERSFPGIDAAEVEAAHKLLTHLRKRL
ncbi:MAG: MarR family transcriptional regulator [Desulfosarcinaceae bacterium]|jgi:DNA-binding MarR family transcriptional regulator